MLRSLFSTFILCLWLCQFNATAQSIERYIASFSPSNDAKISKDKGFIIAELKSGVSKSDLRAVGIKVKRTILNNYIVIDKSQIELASDYVSFSKEINNKWKLSDQLLFTDKKSTTVIVKTSDYKSLNFPFHSLGKNLVLVNLDKVSLETILNNDQVLSVTEESINPKVESRVLDMNLNPNQINFVHDTYPELTGEGIVVSIKEQGYDTEDIDLLKRNIVSNLASDEISNHATEMATIIAGAGNSFITGRGVASKAKVTSSDFTDILPDDDGDYVSLNAYVQNHSYGTQIENFYGSLAEAYDLSANNNLNLLHIFSSGNEGLSASDQGQYAGIEGVANLTGNFKHSKNTLVIGSIDTVNIKPEFVSNGPAYDGRVKPELVAYSSVGASNSAALVSGIAALLQQEYKSVKGTLPPSALIKALLINQATDVGMPNVDFKTGFGNVNAYRSVEALKNSRYLSGEVSNGESLNFEIEVPDKAVNLKLTLVWNDPSGTVNSSKALVNDIDMSLSNGTATYLPWILNTSPAFIKDAAVRGFDRLNNIEQISIEDPISGTYQIKVSGFDVPNGPQEFFISYSWKTNNEFLWTFPTSSDNMPYNGETKGYFRWDTSFKGKGRLDFSSDNGNNWQLIDSNVNLESGLYSWQPDDTFGSHLVRMNINGQHFESSPFSVARTLNAKVGFNCGDSILLQWAKDPFALGYNVLQIDNAEELKLLSTVPDTSLVVLPMELGTNRFAVKPNYGSGLNPIGSPTFNYQLANNRCYLNSFTGEVKDNTIELRLNLDLLYGVSTVEFERLNPSGNQLIETTDGMGTSIKAVDYLPEERLNFYRCKIGFNNGATIISDTISVFFIDAMEAFVFPNPITELDFLSIYTKDFDGSPLIFELYNRTGEIVFQQELFSDRSSVILPSVTKGLYLYRIYTPNGQQTGRLIILPHK